MKRTACLFLVTASLVLGSCVTAPVPPRKTSDDCLVLIRTVINKYSTEAPNMFFDFTLSAGYGVISTPNTDRGYMMVKIHETGVKITSITGHWSGSVEMAGGRAVQTLDIALPYRNGEVVVADFCFVQTVTKTSKNYIHCAYDFNAISNNDKAALVKQLKERKDALSWLP